MNESRQALIVARNPVVGNALIAWLSMSGFEIVLVTTFEAARRQLAERPSLLVTELKLGEYNGLHLALRASAAKIPAIVLGTADAVLQRDADRLGATYFTGLPTREEFSKTVADIVHDPIAAHVDPALLRVPTAHGFSRPVVH
jgi:DNA-binding NtrC family response regulator